MTSAIPVKITLFTHNAKIGIDQPLCHKSKSYVDELIRSGEAYMLPPGVFRRPAARLYPPRSIEQGNETLMAAAHETSVKAALTATETQANVGIAETAGAVLRAQAKVKAWMSPDTKDERSPLPRGSWANVAAIQVTATA